MKKIIQVFVTISLISFTIAILSVIFALIIVSKRDAQARQQESRESINTTNSTSSSETASENNTQLTTAEVAKHNTSSNCWLIISDSVYNVTSFLTAHPGGISVITPYCGKEATLAFNSKDKNPSSKHSQNALKLLAVYLIGRLNEQVAQNSTNKTIIPTLPASPPLSTQLTQGSTGQTTTGTLATAEVATHNTPSNCWLIISGKAFNVTNFLTSHPGGVNTITPYCGKDATNAFVTKGGKGSNHSNNAYSMLNNYFVGALAGATSAGGGGTTAGGANMPNQNQPSTGGGTLPPSVSSKYPGATISQQNTEDNGSQELEIIYNGECRHIKVDASGTIKEDKTC